MRGAIRHIESYCEFGKNFPYNESVGQVQELASRSLEKLMKADTLPACTHLVVATTCPDKLSPSLGQCLNQQYNKLFSDTHVIDIVQGCAGGATALILGSQLASIHNSSVLVVQADAARKACSVKSNMHSIFGNGSSACLITGGIANRGLLHSKSRQYKGLHEVVTVNLGHDAGYIIKKEKDIAKDPRKYLGLSMKNSLALKLFKKAEGFFKEFVNESSLPDMMILHQVNPLIIRHLESVFKKYPVEFVNVASLTGNCGAASVGISLDRVKEKTRNKKLMICSFGTGGVMTAGLWQM